MITEIDERNGVVKTSWQNVRKRVLQVEPTFAKIVDELGPDKSFPLYLAYYPYGAIKGDTQSTFLPGIKNDYFRISDSSTPKDLIKDLGYSIHGAPFAMLLEKHLELFVDLPDEKVTIPRTIYKPGAFFPFSKLLSRKSARTYAPNGVLTLTSGARSVFMLPNIGCTSHHVNLQRDYNVQSSPPKNLYDQWFVFREITNSPITKCSWRSCLMYFSQKWLDKLENDKKWLPLKIYLHEMAWSHYEYQRNSFYYDVFYSIIQKRRNLKPNPYLVDTARHLFTIALGSLPGYTLATDENYLPVQSIENAFVESYGLKKYTASILHPAHFNFEKDNFPIYYSLQHPSTHMFSPKSRAISSTLTEMRELAHIIKIFSQELSKEMTMCSDTVLSQVAKWVQFHYFHNKRDPHGTINHSSKIPHMDNRFNLHNHKSPHENATFAADAPFVRGCVLIKPKCADQQYQSAKA